MSNVSSSLWIGVDVGSTTAKAVIVDPQTNTLLFSRYTRHNARQMETVYDLLSEISRRFPDTPFRIALCGSGGKTSAELLQVPYIQEVVANSIAIKKWYPKTRIAIELGGQDAKIVFFYHDKATNKLIASDMRMNGSCAGGTGAFIDEVASLLKIPVEQFEEFATRGSFIYDISGRCGVFAKTDIQPLLNQGVRREDIALSTFHAIAKQTIGGLAQGLELKPPITFEGGPLTFNPTLIRVFAERLNLSEADIIRPQSSETLVACGAALSLGDLFSESKDPLDHPAPFEVKAGLAALAAYREHLPFERQTPQKAWFVSEEEKKAFYERHKPLEVPVLSAEALGGQPLRVYLGIDSGSTTTKFVLLDEDEQVVDRFYSSNNGEPLHLIRDALRDLEKKYRDLGIPLEIIAVGTTGYGEHLFYKTLHADFHSVETVAHAAAVRKYMPGATFILDIGGQDMKAITIARDIVTDITLNEACSAGCGSFLESFAKSLTIPVDQIAEAAFNAQHPAELGSRCTVFMNSCIISEQRNGKQADDLMAGLCRSIIDNVFTKVVRVSNLASLGDKIVVQGGTFKNDAVLRALEQYTGRPIIRAPYPGEMGAIGIALLTKKHVAETPAFVSRFIGLGAMKDFNYTQESNSICPFCNNNCSRTLLRFSGGGQIPETTYVTGNRCKRGEIIGDPRDTKTREKVKLLTEELEAVPDLMKKRETLLFRDYPFTQVNPDKDITIGLPRSLEFWDSMPFWTTFWKSLGFKVQISRPSTRRIFEQGLPFVASDTICFPAKLVHGHIRDLAFRENGAFKENGADRQVDRIFMPMLIRTPSENAEPLSDYVCAVVKGYPLIIQYSDNPARRWNTVFDTPMFHWFIEKDRTRQICDFMQNTFNLSPAVTQNAISQGDAALAAFREELCDCGARIIADLEKQRASGGAAFGVVLAGRPYHNDELVNHDLSSCFIRQGIPVLTVDSLPGINRIDLSMTRTEIVNNFHARMLSGAMVTAQQPALEYVQIVSFGCGHDAILSDEVIRILNEVSGKTPLILKLDESSISGPLTIRVKSFIETVKTRRAKGTDPKPRSLKDPYPVKFIKSDWKKKTILIPNVSRAFCQIISAAIARQGFTVEPLPMGGRDAIKLGKKYVHNDICFPAQMNIGEALSVLESGNYNTEELVIGMGKYQCDCRLAQYTSLARKAFDEAGFSHVPIVTTDKLDSKNMFPGFRLGLPFEIRMVWGLVMTDILEDLRRKMRPYEKNPGETDRMFAATVDAIADGLARNGIGAAIGAYKKGIGSFCKIPFDRSSRKNQVFITGEFLLNFHPGSNFEVESYLEKYNMEVILPRLSYQFWKDYIRMQSEVKDFHVSRPFQDILFAHIGDGLFNFILRTLEKPALRHPLYEPSLRLPEIAGLADPIMNRTFTSGEGFLIPGEIVHYAKAGVRSFIILQPFGCIPNHISGRGIVKRIKEDFPQIQILPLDYDPDTSFANIENRLQMLIMNARE